MGNSSFGTHKVTHKSISFLACYPVQLKFVHIIQPCSPRFDPYTVDNFPTSCSPLPFLNQYSQTPIMLQTNITFLRNKIKIPLISICMHVVGNHIRFRFTSVSAGREFCHTPVRLYPIYKVHRLQPGRAGRGHFSKLSHIAD